MAELSDGLIGVKLRAGDTVLMESRTGLLIEKLARPEVEELVLEEVPDVTYADVGGLDDQIEAITDAVELPYLYRDLYAEHKLPAPKGILLYGPPGCGKTLIAKAVANSLAKKVAEVTGNNNARSYFLNIKGPELLNKYVGETERQIRLVFQRAREKSEEGVPVIVFFDEMDSLFRTRGTGISSDMESTIVPQLLAEIDGVETLKDVIVIGASNREDLIDPAILRPGRLDVKIRIERPNEVAAAQIFSRYLTPDLPLDAEEVQTLGGGDPAKATQAMIETTVAEMYRNDEENRFLEVTYQNGDKEVLYYRDFSSGAMIENIVRRAKKLAIKRAIAEERPGHPDRRPARVHPPGVQGERGSPQHHQPRRLGEDLGQEGRADRLHPHAHQRPGGDQGWPVHRAGGHRSVSLSHRPRIGSTRGHPQGLRHRDRVRHPGGARRPQPDRRLVGADQRLRPRRGPPADGLGLRGRGAGQRRPRLRPRGPMPPQVETHLVNTVLTNGARYYVDHAHPEYSTPECRDALECLRYDRAGELILIRSMEAADLAVARRLAAGHLQEQLRRQGQLLRGPRELPDGPGRPVHPDRGRRHPPLRHPPDLRRGRQGGGGDATHDGAAGRLPALPAGRVLRGAGGPGDHPQAAHRQHPGRAPRRSPALPPAPRHRGRRQPGRGGHLLEGGHHLAGAGHDRGRRLRRAGAWPWPTR